MADDYRYRAFISYSHQDRAWGDWLHKALETYRVPRRLVGQRSPAGEIPRRLFPVFRDRDELPSSADLSRIINEALRQSRTLIVICSPQSASSRWVNEEIKYFKSLGRADRVLCVIVGGEPWASDHPYSGLAECFPPALRFVVGADGELSDRRAEPVAADARGGKDGRAKARLKLIAGMLGISFDDLRQRERQRLRWRRSFATTAAITFSLLAAAGWHWQQTERRQALDAQALKTRIAHLYESGHRELLDHHEARAAVYLNEVHSLGVDTPALRFMLARAMRSVDAEQLRVQTGSPVLFVRLSPDGSRFLTVGEDDVLRVWNSATGMKLNEWKLGLSNAAKPNLDAVFSDRGTLIVADVRSPEPKRHQVSIFDPAQDRMVVEYDADSDFPSRAVPVPLDALDRKFAYIQPDKSIAIGTLDSQNRKRIPGRYTVSRFCRDGRSLIAADESGTIRLFDDRTGDLRHQFKGLHGTVVALDSSNDCNTLAAATLDGAVKIWRVQSGEILMSGGQSGSVEEIRLSPDGKRLMTSTSDSIGVWNGYTGSLIYSHKYPNPQNHLTEGDAALQRIASLDDDALNIVDPRSGFALYSLDGHLGSPRSFFFSADGTYFISGAADGSAVIWKLPQQFVAELPQSGAEDAPPIANGTIAGPVAYSHDGTQFFMAAADGSGSVLDSASIQPRIRLPSQGAPLSAVAFSPDDKTLATGDSAQSIHLWDVASGRLLQTLGGLGGPVWNIRFDPPGRLLSGAVIGAGVRLWSVNDTSRVEHFELDHLAAAAFSPDGGSFVIGIHGEAKCWDAINRRFRWSVALPAEGSTEPKLGVIAFSPDGKRILVTHYAHDAYLLDAGDGHILVSISDDRSGAFWPARFSADGMSVALGDANDLAFLWKLSSGQLLTLTGHTSAVTITAFSPDSALLLSTGDDGVEKIWDAQTGDLLDSFVIHEGSVNGESAQFSPDGGHILSSGSDNVARIGDVHEEQRSDRQLAELLQCRVAWRVNGESLVPLSFGARDCFPHPAN